MRVVTKVVPESLTIFMLVKFRFLFYFEIRGMLIFPTIKEYPVLLSECHTLFLCIFTEYLKFENRRSRRTLFHEHFSKQECTSAIIIT